jgi:hypothetical protein
MVPAGSAVRDFAAAANCWHRCSALAARADAQPDGGRLGIFLLETVIL